MKKVRGKLFLFRVDEIVAIKIDKVDKIFFFYFNVFIGKIFYIENNYIKVVISYGIIFIFIFINRLNKCIVINNVFDYFKEIFFLLVCK